VAKNEKSNAAFRFMAERVKTSQGIKPRDLCRATRAKHGVQGSALGLIPFIMWHITRQRVKTILITLVAFFFVVMQGFIQASIHRTLDEIDRLYDNTVVKAEIRRANSFEHVAFRDLGNVISTWTIRNVDKYIQNEYVDAGHAYSTVIPADPDGALPENWDTIAGIDLNAYLSETRALLYPLLGVNDLGLLLAAHSGIAGDDLPGGVPHQMGDASSIMEHYLGVDDLDLYFLENPDIFDFRIGKNDTSLSIVFAAGYDPTSFQFEAGRPVPAILSNRTMFERGLEPGDMVYIAFTVPGTGVWEHMPAVVIGTHNRKIFYNKLEPATVIPISAMEQMLGDETGYITFRFDIDGTFNRELLDIRDEIRSIINDPKAGWAKLSLSMNDAQLRLVISSMEKNLSLFRLLYPMAIILSVIIGLGLSTLLMLQNSKKAAILRVLGKPRKRVCASLCAEQVVVSLLGVVLGLLALTIIGWGHNASSSFLLGGLYFVCASAGAALGAALITNRPPIVLLQAKE